MKIINKVNKFFFYLSLFLISFLFSIAKNTADLDLWHRMAVGKIFSQLGNVVYHDIFTYFPAKPLWVDHEWLSGVIFYNLGHFFGDYGILSLKISILFSIIVLIYKTNQLIWPEPGKYRIGFYFVSLVALVIGIAATLRCQVFTYFFFTLWIYVLERIRRKGENRLIWIFPATTLVWLNMHAGFFAGFGLLFFYAAGEFLNSIFESKETAFTKRLLHAFSGKMLKYIGIIALCLPVTLINPYGIKYWPYLIEATTMARPYITEWQPLNPFESFYKVIGTKMQVILVFPALFYRLLLKYKDKFRFFNPQIPAFQDSKSFSEYRKIDWVEIISFCITLYLCIKHLRHVVFFSIITAVFGYKYFAVFMDVVFSRLKDKIFGIIPEHRYNISYFTKHAVIYSFVVNTCLLIIFGTPHAINLGFYPTKAVEFIKINKLEGNLMVPFNWGSYAMWKLYPQNLVSIDGRYEETYTNEAYMDISTITFYNKKLDRKNWKKTFEKYHHDVLLVNKENLIHKEFRKLKNWKIIYEDEKAIVFVPLATPDKKWLQPNKDENYYIKTKYENNINF